MIEPGHSCRHENEHATLNCEQIQYTRVEARYTISASMFASVHVHP